MAPSVVLIDKHRSCDKGDLVTGRVTGRALVTSNMPGLFR